MEPASLTSRHRTSHDRSFLPPGPVRPTHAPFHTHFASGSTDTARRGRHARKHSRYVGFGNEYRGLLPRRSRDELPQPARARAVGEGWTGCAATALCFAISGSNKCIRRDQSRVKLGARRRVYQQIESINAVGRIEAQKRGCLYVNGTPACKALNDAGQLPAPKDPEKCKPGTN
mgnify:CR=1 FL=1